MPLPDDNTYTQARARLLAHTVPAYEGEAPSPAAAVHELARLNSEAADLLAEQGTALEIAATHRRQAAVLVHLAAEHPEYEPDARRAVEVWQAAEERAAVDALARDVRR